MRHCWLRRGERLPGFGHKLYINGDPRARKLLELIGQAYPDSPTVVLSQAVIEAAQSMIDRQSNIDFALATLARALDLPSGAAFDLFALGRTVGWIGHAIEQYALGVGDLIRPRAQYNGPLVGGRS